MNGIDPGCDSCHSQGYYNILNVRLNPCIRQENINYVKRAFFNCVDVKLCLSLEGRFHACCVVPLLGVNAAPCTCVMLPRRCQSDPLAVLWCLLHPISCLCTQLAIFRTPNSWNFRAAEVRRCNEFSRYSCVLWCDVLSLVIFIHVPFLKGRKLCHDITMKSVLCFSALIF